MSARSEPARWAWRRGRWRRTARPFRTPGSPQGPPTPGGWPLAGTSAAGFARPCWRVLVRRRQGLLLCVRLRLKGREIVSHSLRVLQRPLNGQRVAVGFAPAPKRLVADDDRLFQLVPRGLGLRPVLLERLIEPENLGRKGLELGLLAGEEGKADADQRSQNQRQEQADQPRHLTDHAARVGRLVVFGEPLLRHEAGVAASEDQDENNDADDGDSHSSRL